MRYPKYSIEIRALDLERSARQDKNETDADFLEYILSVKDKYVLVAQVIVDGAQETKFHSRHIHNGECPAAALQELMAGISYSMASKEEEIYAKRD